MNCFIGIEKKLEDDTMCYREPVQIDKDWSNMFRFFCSRNKSGGHVLLSLKLLYCRRGQTIGVIQFRGNKCRLLCSIKCSSVKSSASSPPIPSAMDEKY